MTDKGKLLKTGQRLQLTETSKTHYILPVAKSKSKPTIPAKVAFEPTAEEREIIQAAQGKYGIRKATDIIRMALKRLADTERVELKAS